MDMEKLSEFLNIAGVTQADVHAFGHIPMSPEQLVTYSRLLIEECAKVQVERSSARHGYDKYDDGEAIHKHFKLA